MEKLYKYLNMPLKRGLLGIEVEVEGENLPEGAIAGWCKHADGSLRGESAEYVFAQPLGLFKAKQALDVLRLSLKESRIEWSFRTSVHVHMNVQTFTCPTLKSFIYSYLLVEDLLMEYCGEERKNNRFCLRMRDAEALLHPITDMMERPYFHFPRIDMFRYAALNLDAICKFGSLEFRGMRGTLDKTTLEVWITALTRLRAYAVRMSTFQEVASHFERTPNNEWLNEVFGKAVSSHLTKNVADVDGLLSRNYSLTASLLIE